jgi:hypothetical protein
LAVGVAKAWIDQQQEETEAAPKSGMPKKKVREKVAT